MFIWKGISRSLFDEIALITWNPRKMPLIPGGSGGRQEMRNVVMFIMRTRTSAGADVGAERVSRIA